MNVLVLSSGSFTSVAGTCTYSATLFHDPYVVINGKIQAPTDNRSTTVHPSLTLSADEQVWILHRRERFFRFCYFMKYCSQTWRWSMCRFCFVCGSFCFKSRPECQPRFFLWFSFNQVPSVRPLPVFSTFFRIHYFLLALSFDIIWSWKLKMPLNK